MSKELSEQEQVRRESLQKIRDLGIDPYPAAQFPVDATATAIKSDFTDQKEVVIAGRLMSRRVMGKASFAEIMDHSGRIQIYVNRDEICEGEDKTMYNTVFKKLLDIGDFIGLKGYQFKTQVGEISVHVKELTVLSKSIRPIPIVKTDEDGNVHDAFADTEMRYRQRYLDLVVTPGQREHFAKRTKVMNAMRSFFDESGYLEVETPVLQPIPGGAAARPFTTHHNTLDQDLYLRIANELYLKRLIVGGYEGVYEFSRNFRNEGMDRTHNPEFTVMEIYVAYKDYFWMMDFTEEMVKRCAKAINPEGPISIGDNQIDFDQKFARLRFLEGIEKYAGTDVSEMDEEALRAFCKTKHIEVEDSMGRAKLLDEIFGECVEPNLIQPTFVMDYPVEMSPLCKRHREDDTLTERFELFMNGKELANAYSELNDPIDQLERFQEQLKLADRGDDEAMFIDHDFVRALEYGMPPTSGMGIGVDRLIMFLTNKSSIQDVLFFPQMKAEQ